MKVSKFIAFYDQFSEDQKDLIPSGIKNTSYSAVLTAEPFIIFLK